MGLTIVPNSGILGDDRLDRLRGDAILASQEGLPEAVVYYLRAIERRYLDMQSEEKRRGLDLVAWKHVTTDPDALPPTTRGAEHG